MKPQVLVFLSGRVWDLAQFYIGYINHIRFGDFFFSANMSSQLAAFAPAELAELLPT